MTTIAASLNGSRPVCPSAEYEPVAEPVQWLNRGQTAAVAMSIALGLVVAGYGLAGSYLTIADLADRPPRTAGRAVPAGIDGGLVAVVVLDLALIWIGTPVSGPRVARSG